MEKIDINFFCDPEKIEDIKEEVLSLYDNMFFKLYKEKGI